MLLLEIACFNLESALIAEKAGADRIELCDNYAEGGTTPSLATIEAAVRMLKIPVFVMIRPRGGDFIYTDIDFSLMKRDIELCRNAGAAGVVFGMLNVDNKIDSLRCAELISIAGSMKTTFHKAFDEIKDQKEALEKIISLGFYRVLTSGGAPSAIDGTKSIKALLAQSAGRIQILAGGGVRSNNVIQLISLTGVSEIHSAAISSKNIPYPTASEEEIISIKTLL